MPISRRRKVYHQHLANSKRRPDLSGPGPGTTTPARHEALAGQAGSPRRSCRGYLWVPVVDDNMLTRMGAHPARLRGVKVALETVLSCYCGRFAVIFWAKIMLVMSGLSLIE